MGSRYFFLSAVLACLLKNDIAEALTPCSKEGRQMSRRRCLAIIKRKALSRTEFWMGTDFLERCPDGPDTSDCFNPNFDRIPLNTIVSTITGSNNPKFLSRINRYLEIRYTREPGSYQACGNTYRVPDSKNFSVDPTSPAVFRPFDVRALPEVRWRTRYGDGLFTLIMVDAPLGNVVHWIAVNIRDNDVKTADTIFQYLGSLNPFPVDNPYIFLLFKQAGRIKITDKLIAEIIPPSNTALQFINVPRLARRLRLRGPVAINWMKIRHDPFSIQRINDLKLGNFCPFLVTEALNNLKREFIPRNTDLTVNVDVTYKSPPIRFTSCCNIRSIPSSIVKLNPIGNGMINTAVCNEDPEIKLIIKEFSDGTDFKGKLYTLLLLSPDEANPIFGNRSRPFVRLMVTNIQNGNVTDGDEILENNGCITRETEFHFFLLYEQTNKIRNGGSFLTQNCPFGGGRCLFDISRFTQENNLKLVGASWMVTEEDAFSTFSIITRRGMDPSDICAGVPGFDLPCPNGQPVAALLNQ